MAGGEKREAFYWLVSETFWGPEFAALGRGHGSPNFCWTDSPALIP